uniref:2EXR domain-containing protein n=1 Tax=Bionectria ochroleuca TaxID=29856 RepID=A0A8H7NQ10_BIOOC
MSSLPELFNPILGHGSEQSFPQFSKFPLEIRVHIFKLSLLRERFFQLWLERDDQLVGPKDRISGNRYIVNVQGRNIHSKLLRVNRDARHAALAFTECTFHVDMSGVAELGAWACSMSTQREISCA